MADLTIRIRRNKDGATADIEADMWAGNGKTWENASAYWTDGGNASCDCNRRIFFNSAHGKRTPDSAKCSEGKFSITVFNASGEVVYDETECGA